MARPRPRIGSELLPLVLILLCLGGTLALVVAVHRRGAAPRRSADTSKLAATPAVPPVPPPAAEQEPGPDAPPPVVTPPPEDPTAKALAELASAVAMERDEARKADAHAESLEAARRAALEKSARWRRRESLVRAQVDELAERARRTQMELDTVALERDALARERDAAKAKLAKARASSSYAILPHKGPNGTWRRPIVVECRNGAAILQPRGAAFGMLELSALSGLRNSPFVRAVARELVRISGESAPDGAASVPYIFFVIRPDGIRPYYEARARLETLGIAFGYELVEQDWEIDFSDLENPPGTDPLSPSPASRPGAVAGAERDELSWPGERSGPKRGNDPLDNFVWHSRPTGAPNGNAGSRNGSERAGGARGAVVSGLPPGDTDRGAGDGDGDGNGNGGPPGTPAAPKDSRAARGVGDLAFASPGAPAGGTPGGPQDQPPSIGMAGGRSATERAFGTPGSLSPVSPGGLPTLEPAGGSAGPGGGTRPSGTGTGGARRSFSGPRGRASVGIGSGLTSAEDDEPPQDGRVPVPPPGYFNDEDEDEEAQNARPGSRGRRAGGGSSSTNMGEGSPGSDAGGIAGAAAGATDSEGASAGSPAGSVGGSGRGSGAAQGSRKGSLLADRAPLRIEVPFEMTVVCSRAGVIIHPGGYRLSPASLKSKDRMLIKELNAVLQQRREVDPLIVPQPRLRFLVEPGGAQSYDDARKQTALAGLAWPTTIQVGETSVISFSGRETKR